MLHSASVYSPVCYTLHFLGVCVVLHFLCVCVRFAVPALSAVPPALRAAALVHLQESLAVGCAVAALSARTSLPLTRHHTVLQDNK